MRPTDIDPLWRDPLGREKLLVRARALLKAHCDQRFAATERFLSWVSARDAEATHVRRQRVMAEVALIPLAYEMALDHLTSIVKPSIVRSLQQPSSFNPGREWEIQRQKRPHVEWEDVAPGFDVVMAGSDRFIPEWQFRAYRAVGRWDYQLEGDLEGMVGILVAASIGHRVDPLGRQQRWLHGINLPLWKAEDAYYEAKRVVWGGGEVTHEHVLTVLDPNQDFGTSAKEVHFMNRLQEFEKEAALESSGKRELPSVLQCWDRLLLLTILLDPNLHHIPGGDDRLPVWAGVDFEDKFLALFKGVLQAAASDTTPEGEHPEGWAWALLERTITVLEDVGHRVNSPAEATPIEVLCSPDFRVVRVGAVEYRFSTPQAACFQALWRLTREGKLSAAQTSVFELVAREEWAKIGTKRLSHVFRQGSKGGVDQYHKAWNTIIKPDRERAGFYQLTLG
jgi:hypothetical protein